MTKYQKYKLIILSVFCFFLLLILWNYSANGRYVAWEGGHPMRFDTKTGRLYLPISEGEDLNEYRDNLKKGRYIDLKDYTELE